MTFHGSNNGFDYHIVADLGLDDLAFVIRRQRGSPLAATERRMSRTRKTKVSAVPMREVTTLVYLVEINELVIASLGLASWRTTDLSGEDRHGSSAG
jgi:hypothetical protein